MLVTVRHIWRAAIAILATASLAVSAVSGCTCSQHHEVHEPKAPCHANAEHEGEKIKTIDPTVQETCVCVQSPDERSVKAESFKLKKHAPAVLPGQLILEDKHLQSITDLPTSRHLVLYRARLQTSLHTRGPPVI